MTNAVAVENCLEFAYMCLEKQKATDFSGNCLINMLNICSYGMCLYGQSVCVHVCMYLCVRVFLVRSEGRGY